MEMHMDIDSDTTPMPPPHELISRPEAGRILGCGPRGVDGMLRRGELHAWRIGQRVKLRRQEVLEYTLRAAGWVPAGEVR
ncbi:helix-turn-helix domain-containing protein [Mycobacteroides abscessus]|uniref:helix-turn-helix domain-containing protein n=1 Tax=Mycobacteroides abscessus TaxID=36809 RepID=UPI0019D1F93A|nr:helix-turn-helix domain-containing protein [Mycobacteroides abscessus]MBN7296585.1 helix-turn-helix domain-containing protein [Mycobacteroides abscessus subsp. abscessus]